MKKQLLLLLLLPVICAYTIAEKKESFSHNDQELDHEMQAQLSHVNETIANKRLKLHKLYEKASDLHCSQAKEAAYVALLQEINGLKAEIAGVEETWRIESSALIQTDSYALWHQPDTTVSQLVMDYGAQDCIYLIPPEVSQLRLSINSNLPIPRESWCECLELILSGQGVGVRQLNPYLRELFFLRNQPSAGLQHITSDPRDLDLLPSLARICFVLSPETAFAKNSLQFLQKFSNPMTTSMHLVEGNIFIISTTEAIKELLKLYDFVQAGNQHQ